MYTHLKKRTWPEGKSVMRRQETLTTIQWSWKTKKGIQVYLNKWQLKYEKKKITQGALCLKKNDADQNPHHTAAGVWGGQNWTFSQDGWRRRMMLQLKLYPEKGRIRCMFTCGLFCVLTCFWKRELSHASSFFPALQPKHSGAQTL